MWRKSVLAYAVSVITDGFGEFGEKVCNAPAARHTCRLGTHLEPYVGISTNKSVNTASVTPVVTIPAVYNNT